MDERSRNEVSPPHHHLMKLELRLAPPGADEQQQHWSRTTTKRHDDSSSVLSLGYFPHHHATIKASPSPSSSPQQAPLPLQNNNNNNNNNNNADKKVFSPSSANTAVPNISQKRTAPGPVVGWPPIRSFRKNLASSSSSKPPPPPPEHHNKVVPAAAALDKNNNSYGGKGMFVKINMDGVPIGRKVDLNAYDSYENLSNAVDQLFRGLLAAQRDNSSGGSGVNKLQEEEKVITGLLDGSGEYTLVYEDNEGDRMLVGDVPWHMFVSTVKRLRVLKSSELSAFTLGGNKQDKDAT
ncbi:Auxin-responsive protein iaa26 [Stylosanthes scabra]|uniref:Auxin-induced protein n=1 Tax=Stylosanthes scabra TaxID=79078 RepID=A0ABU6Q5Z6_9FABA|nr:Auxin-responsive protein iaa26 [Stylosanthes scabra]